jgi:pentatricopeptide repeat protein
MKLLASKKCYKEALDVFSKLEADGFEPSLTTLGCLVSFAAELGEADRAIALFNRLASTGMPSIRAHMTILRVYSKRSDWLSSLAIIRDMQRREAPIDCLVLNVVLATGVSVGQLDATSALLKEFSQVGVADVVSYNTLIKGFARRKGADKAIQLLDEMCQTGVKPNVITFNTAMDAAVRSFRVPDAWRMLLRMRGAGLTPDKFTCTTLMKGLQNDATSQQLSEILDLLRNVTAQCDSALASSLFRSVIEATAKINDPALTARAVVQMREQQVMLSSADYHRLLQLLMRDEGKTQCSTAFQAASFQNRRL